MITTELLAGEERRGTVRLDRRKKDSPWYAFQGGRRRVRRTHEQTACIAADGIARPVAMVASLLMLLSLVDAFATLHLLERGCEEANPAMRYLLNHGAHAFLLGKFAITGMGILFLLNFRYHRFFANFVRVGHMLIAITGLYAVLNLYQAVLLVVA